MLTEATRSPCLNKVWLNKSLSQFKSTIVIPLLIPSICVCTAPDTPDLHIKLFTEFIDGEFADGGVLSTVTVELETVFVFEYAFGKNKINVISKADIK
jgi:hypothetical protein